MAPAPLVSLALALAAWGVLLPPGTAAAAAEQPDSSAEPALTADDECLLEGGAATAEAGGGGARARCALSAAQLRSAKIHAGGGGAAEAEAKAEAEASADSQGWPFGQPSSQYKKIGEGGCSTPLNQYPSGMKKSTGVSGSACKTQCDFTWGCGAYEFCSGSNCNGNCQLYTSDTRISTTNKYPGVSCYVKEDKTNYQKIGEGGCSTPFNQYPSGMKKSTGVSDSACKTQCDNTWGCGAYEFCSGSNCNGNCQLYSSDSRISTTNKYPGVSCYVKGKN